MSLLSCETVNRRWHIALLLLSIPFAESLVYRYGRRSGTLRCMSVNNPVTSAWSSLAALCLPVEELKNKHGVTFHCSPKQNEMCLTAGDCTIIITRGHNEISAVMHEPNGRILERKFSVEGGIDYPSIG